MRILFLCHRLPYPPKRGGKIRPFNMIRHLARSHEVTVATLARSAAELAEGRDLASHCHEVHVGRISTAVGWARFALHAAGPFPSTFAYFHSPTLARTVRRLLATRDFDAILVHCSSMGPYVSSHRGCRKIMDFGDADSEKWLEYAGGAPFPLSAGFRLEGRKVRRYERWLGSMFDACSVNAPREREILALMAEGRSNQGICGALWLSPKTVEAHIRNVFAKLGITAAAEDNRRVLAVLTYLRR